METSETLNNKIIKRYVSQECIGYRYPKYIMVAGIRTKIAPLFKVFESVILFMDDTIVRCYELVDERLNSYLSIELPEMDYVNK